MGKWNQRKSEKKDAMLESSSCGIGWTVKIMQADTGYAFECGNTDAGYCFAWKRSEVFAGLEIKLRMKNLVTRKGKKKNVGAILFSAKFIGN